MWICSCQARPCAFETDIQVFQKAQAQVGYVPSDQTAVVNRAANTHDRPPRCMATKFCQGLRLTLVVAAMQDKPSLSAVSDDPEADVYCRGNAGQAEPECCE